MNSIRPYRTPTAPLHRIASSIIALTACATRNYNFFGLYRMARWLEPLFKKAGSVVITVHPGIRLSVPADAYWLRLLASSYNYEPEVLRLLQEIAQIPYVFLDCGANIGYWSCLLSDNYLGAKRGAAVEPGEQAFAFLQENLTANSSNVVPFRRAIGERDDEWATLYLTEGRGCDAGASITGEESGDHSRTHRESVQTISLDTLIRHIAPDPDSSIVIKLDIEGMEHQVIQSSQEISVRDCLIIAEDHGSDHDCRVTEALLDRGFQVAFLHDKIGGTWIDSPVRLMGLKSNPYKGYNIIALKRGSRFANALANIVAVSCRSI